MAKQTGTFEQHWRARHRRALDAAHKQLLAPLCDAESISLDLDDLYKASAVYEKAMGCKDLDSDLERNGDGDAGPVYRWMDVFGKTWRREVRQKGAAFVLCEAFDVAMKAALLAVGEFWPEDSAGAAAGKVTPITRRSAA